MTKKATPPGFYRNAYGEIETLANLMELKTADRWVASRKAEIVCAVRDGAISKEDACASFSITIEEFQMWYTQYHEGGLKELRTTRIQDKKFYLEKANLVNYRNLLKKYMAHVIGEESVSFLDHHGDGGLKGAGISSDEELLLRQIEGEIEYERCKMISNPESS